MVSEPSWFASAARQVSSDVEPSAMFTARISSSIVTTRLPLQSPTHADCGVTLGVGDCDGVAVADTVALAVAGTVGVLVGVAEPVGVPVAVALGVIVGVNE